MNESNRLRVLLQRLLKVLAVLVIHPAAALVTAVVEFAGSVGDLIGWRSERQKALAELLDDRRATWRHDLPPSALLRAEYGIVPFHGRDAELAELDSWCDTDRPLGLRLYTAPGGYGKTRLLREEVARRRQAKWVAGFLQEGSEPRDLAKLFSGHGRPLLVVLDYAEGRREETAALVRAALADRRKKTRIVLLARAEHDWWRQLQQEGEGVGDFFQGLAAQGPIRLQAPFGSRERVFRGAARAFAEQRRRPTPEEVPTLDDPAFDRLLLVHIAALAAVEGSPAVPPRRLLEWLLNRELQAMRRAARAADLPVSLNSALPQAAALVTLAGGADTQAEGREILDRCPLLAGQARDRLWQVTSALHRLYPGRKWCEGVQPDLLGEHLVARQLTDDAALLDAAFGNSVPVSRLVAGLKVLTRLSKREPKAEVYLDQAFSSNLSGLALPAVEVALTLGDPIGLRLAVALQQRDEPEIEQQIESKLPNVTTALREVAVVVTGRRADRLRHEPGDQAVVLARCLNDLSVRLVALGRPDAALAAINEAVEHWRLLASSRPEVYEPDLAGCLNNQSSCLSAVGRREAAASAIEEAVEIQRRLASSRREAHEWDLVGYLNNLSSCLSAVDRWEDAQSALEEAARVQLRFASSHPGLFESDFAMTLNNLSNRLADLGRREAALKAVQTAVKLYRVLTSSRAEAFEPALATSLNNLSNRLAAVGRSESALAAIEEAVGIRRRLATIRPEAFEPDLAMSLNNLANHLNKLERHQAALAAIEEAVGLYRRLAFVHPEAFEPELATSLSNLSNYLADVARQEASLAAIEEAVKIQRRLASISPEVFEPDLVKSLNNWAVCLLVMDHIDSALTAVKEAVKIRRRLASNRPEAFEPDLAKCLGLLSRILLASRRPREAREASEEGLRRLRPYYRRYPEVFDEVARQEVQDYLRAVAACGESVDIRVVEGLPGIPQPSP